MNLLVKGEPYNYTQEALTQVLMNLKTELETDSLTATLPITLLVYSRSLEYSEFTKNRISGLARSIGLDLNLPKFQLITSRERKSILGRNIYLAIIDEGVSADDYYYIKSDSFSKFRKNYISKEE